MAGDNAIPVQPITEYERRQIERTLEQFQYAGRNRHVLMVDIDELGDVGGRIYVEPMRPRMKLAPGDYVGEAFRSEMDAWLVDFFGWKPTVLGRGAAVRIQSGAIVNVYDFQRLAALVEESNHGHP